jgi:hypothetical protein
MDIWWSLLHSPMNRSPHSCFLVLVTIGIGVETGAVSIQEWSITIVGGNHENG